LIAQGYLKQSGGQFPVIQLTEKSLDVLKGNVPVELIKATVREEKRSSLVPDVSHEYFRDLLESLKKVRTDFARGENVPPYIIFSDATLVEMATFLPQNTDEMSRISGVGELKLEKYGADFLAVIGNYCEENDLASRIDLKAPRRDKKQRAKRGEKGQNTYDVTLEMFRSGLNVYDIARERGVTLSTVENHLARFIPTGEIALTDLVPEDKIEPIRDAIIKFQGVGALSPIKEYLGEFYTYGEIRAVLADFMGKSQAAAR
jgi:ATP-dependent DNA helicase RecQ